MTETPAQTIAYPSPSARPNRGGRRSPPHVIVLFGATGDLARRKLLPGLAHLAPCRRSPRTSRWSAPRWRTTRRRVPATSPARRSGIEHANRPSPTSSGTSSPTGSPTCRARRPRRASPRRSREAEEPAGPAPPAALPVGAAEGRRGRDPDAARGRLVDRSRVVMEKPFGTDLHKRGRLNDAVHETFDESQIFRIDHFLGKEAAQNILAFRFANGLFEPIWNRNFIDHIQIDIPETLGLDQRASFYEVHRGLQGHGGHPPLPGDGVRGDGAADRPGAAGHQRGEEQGLPLAAADRAAGRRPGPVRGYRDEPAWRPTRTPRPSSRCDARSTTGGGRGAVLPADRQADGRGLRIISIAFKEAPRTMFPASSGVGAPVPDHLTFDLADESKVSLSFYGKRPGPGMKLEKLSMQFSTQETDRARRRPRGLRAADPGRDARRPHAVHHRGGHRAPVGGRTPDRGPAAGEAVRPGAWGPNAIHQLIAPHAWRLPFERAWRVKKYGIDRCFQAHLQDYAT